MWDLVQRRPAVAAFALGIAAFATYMATGRTAWMGDTLPARYLPVAVLDTGTLYIDHAPLLFSPVVPRGPDGVTPYPLRHIGDHYVSWYPIGTGILAVPVYFVAELTGADLHNEAQVERLEKVSASVLVAASVTLLTLALLSLTDWSWALTLGALYAFGTSSLSLSSQALWQHAGSQLVVCIVLYALARGGTENAALLVLAGFASGMAFIARPANAILLLPVIAALTWCRPRTCWWLGLGAVGPLSLDLAYRWAYFGNPLYTQAGELGVKLWQGPWAAGLAGLLVSPGRGLFVYSPMFLLSVVGFVRRGVPLWVRAVGVGSLLTVMVYGRWAPWWGGYSVGPRLLADLSPGLVLGLAPLEGRGWRTAVVCLGAVAVVVHGLGAFTVSAMSWNGWADVDHAPQRLWSWRKGPLACAVHEAFHGVASATRFCRWQTPG